METNVSNLTAQVKVNFDGSLNAALKKLKVKMSEHDQASFENLVNQCVDMYARNGQMKNKDVAMSQLMSLAKRFGVNAV